MIDLILPDDTCIDPDASSEDITKFLLLEIIKYLHSINYKLEAISK